MIRENYMVKEKYSYPLKQKRVAVEVRRINRSNKFQVVPDKICMLKEGTLVSELPSNFKVVDEAGNEIKALGRFLISVETIDPYHLVTDMF